MRNQVLQAQTGLLYSLSDPNKFSGLIISLRYLYDPGQDSRQRLKIYLIINHIRGDQKKALLALKILQKGELSRFYKLIENHQISKNLRWVDAITEIIKLEKFQQGSIPYIPYLFRTNSDNDMLLTCHQLNRLDGKLMLEVTVQVADMLDKDAIANAIIKILKLIHKASSNNRNINSHNSLLPTADKIYDDYQSNYIHDNRNILQYSIKILAEYETDISLFQSSFLHSIFDGTQGKNYYELILQRDCPKFQESLNASEQVKISTAIERDEWQNGFGKQVLEDFGRSSKSRWDFVKLPPPDFISDHHSQLPSTGEIVKSHESSLQRFLDNLPDSTDNLTTVADLKPLCRLVTPEEISSFFRIVIPGEEGVPGIPKEQPKFNTLTAEEIFQRYGEYITEDQYIVGIADDGNPEVSRWDAIAHRLIAGSSGSGKTNFIKWVIFQFLYTQPKSVVYIVDFKGIDFVFLNKLDSICNRITIEKEPIECKNLLNQIYEEEYTYRQNLMSEHGVSYFQDLNQCGFSLNRILLIIDEAADIAKIKPRSVREDIEDSLEKFARRARAMGIHLIYCTQTPKVGLISTQVTAQLIDRVVFHVLPEVGSSVLEERVLSKAEKIPRGDLGRGRAVLAGNEGIKYVNTPKMKHPIPRKIPDTGMLWSKIGASV